MNCAVSRGNLTNNPAANIRSRDIGGLEKPRERFLTSEEIRTPWHFLDSIENKISSSIRCAIKKMVEFIKTLILYSENIKNAAIEYI